MCKGKQMVHEYCVCLPQGLQSIMVNLPCFVLLIMVNIEKDQDENIVCQ